MRITIEAEDENAAIWGMVFANSFISQKRDGDGTADSWGFFKKSWTHHGTVTKKKNGNISVKCWENKGDAA
ncbi:hypothetical protein SOASR030_01610 [Leminorella grimontii]|uniref:Uncharacterized protein n=1 Tax=Leminorella grimontii TaxID=82981 RepID=A0AAV5MYR1_9GAMM|nr:hypothetical protein [Leminorella grimontii]KFC95383.1 hypothetical protein GLGR_1924 [Leminorella grimontii ATCC 33999 = DSM 5078]GKX54049.1 hypothetical protein SOASR030_01610 [Leminorella grimontii]